MLSKSLLSTVFAVHVLASPLLIKRAYSVEEFTVTVMTTVTAGYDAVATSAFTSSTASQETNAQWTWGHHGRHSYSEWTSTSSTSTYVAPVESSASTVEQSSYAPSPSSYAVPSSSYIAPASSDVPVSSSDVSPSSTYVAPSSSDVPAPSSDVSPSPTYVAPSSSSASSTSTYVAPSSSSASSTSTYVAPDSTSSTPVATSSAYSSVPSANPADGTNIDASNFDTSLTPAKAPTLTDASDAMYTALALQHHNAHRANHSVGMVKWDADLAGAAKMLATTCVIKHNEDLAYGSVAAKSYGQNLAGGPSIGEVGTSVTEFWYNGELANYAKAGFGKAEPPSGNLDSWAHFSQVVWSETTHIGCWTQTCPGAMDYTVCNYSPPGNFMIGDPSGAGAIQNYTCVHEPKDNAKWTVTKGQTSVG